MVELTARDYALHQVAEIAETSLASAVVDLHPPEGDWGVARLTIDPMRDGAASIVAWEEEENSLTIVAGQSARFDIFDEKQDDLIAKAWDLIANIASGKFVERSFGRLELEPIVGPGMRQCRLPLEQRKAWRSYEDQ